MSSRVPTEHHYSYNILLYALLKGKTQAEPAPHALLPVPRSSVLSPLSCLHRRKGWQGVRERLGSSLRQLKQSEHINSRTLQSNLQQLQIWLRNVFVQGAATAPNTGLQRRGDAYWRAAPVPRDEVSPCLQDPGLRPGYMILPRASYFI